MHPVTWPIVTELTRGRPRLVSGTLQINAAATDQVQPLRLHCVRDDYGWDAIRYEVRDGRIICDHTVMFPYLTDVRPGDGGLLVVPGSHKSMFERPAEMFNNGVVETLDQLPPGVENITPRAGDMLVMNELVTHGALPWTPRDRQRMILVLRYMPQYSRAPEIPEAVQRRLTRETLELTSHAGYQDVKEIARGSEAAVIYPRSKIAEYAARRPIFAKHRRVVVVRVFVKKTRRTPRRETEVALRRAGDVSK